MPGPRNLNPARASAMMALFATGTYHGTLVVFPVFALVAVVVGVAISFLIILTTFMGTALR
jgi:hypothetical protein